MQANNKFESKASLLHKSKSYETRFDDDDDNKMQNSAIFMTNYEQNGDGDEDEGEVESERENPEKYSYYDENLNSDVLNLMETKFKNNLKDIYSERDYQNENDNNNNESDDNQTKIIVTSFAPKPLSRPMSHQVANSIVPTYQNNVSLNSSDNQDNNQNRKLSLLWPNGKSNIPIVLFCPKVVRKTFWECKKVGEQYRLTYKFMHGERKLIKTLLDGHGFREVHPNSSEFNLIWSGSNLKSYTFRSLQDNQKVNHFPRSCELTRKDRLYKNIQRMQKERSQKAFNIVPTTFVMPYEIDDFYTTFYREKGVWIVKPVSLSRGRGIYLISTPEQIPLEDNLVVSKYISNPLLIEGFKFDLRLYVAVTSFDPLVFYLYEEGLTRFATIKYDQSVRNIKNICMHLTNYSLNKKSEKYVRCDDPHIEDYGNKWSMSAFLRFLNSQGKDTFTLMMNIEEAIIKTLLAVESPLASASRMFMAHRENCFELFGFDILVDDTFKPWVLEVNLSPSLDCDALLDVRVKSSMISDLLTLAGVYCQSPSIYSNRSRAREQQSRTRSEARMKLRPHSAHVSNNGNSESANANKLNDPLYGGLSQVEQSILKTAIDENQRSNGWVRLFPTSDTWEFYSQYLESRSTSFNSMLHKKLFPRRWQGGNVPKKAIQIRPKLLEGLNELYKCNRYNSGELSGPSLYDALERYKRYEHKLVDTIKPTEETLSKLSTMHQQNNPSKSAGSNHTSNAHALLKSSFSMFPNGQKETVAATNGDSTLNNEDEHLSSTSFSSPASQVNSLKANPLNKRPISHNPYLRKQQLPALYCGVASNDRNKSAAIVRHAMGVSLKSSNYSRSKSAKEKNIKQIDCDDPYEFGDHDERVCLYDDEQQEDEDDNLCKNKPGIGKDKPKIKDTMTGTKNDSLSTNQPIGCTSANDPNRTLVEEKNYDLQTLLSHLEEGYYISRIQVRNAFSLYLYKIQLRLINESQLKVDSSIQQMDLVIRFIKKATPNLSQEFKVYIPSKRLPLSEQKRMLAKQLHDFLHIYRKDTEQIRWEISVQLDNERRKHAERLVDEKAFQNLLHKCNEIQLEEIMSVYMKKSQDSSVFLGGPANKSAKNDIESDLFSPPSIIVTTASNLSESLKREAMIDKQQEAEIQSVNFSSANQLSCSGSAAAAGNFKSSKNEKNNVYRQCNASNSRVTSTSKKLRSSLARVHKKETKKPVGNSLKAKPMQRQQQQKNNADFIEHQIATDNANNVSGDEDDLSIKSDFSSLSDGSNGNTKPNEPLDLTLASRESTSKLKRKSTHKEKKTNSTTNSRVDYETTITNIYLNGNRKNTGHKLTKVNCLSNKLTNSATINMFNFLSVDNGAINNNSNLNCSNNNNNNINLKPEMVLPNSENSKLNRLKSASSALSQLKYRKQVSLDSSTSLNSSMNEFNYEEDHANLVNGLKSLTIKQQERLYSAAKMSFVLADRSNGEGMLKSSASAGLDRMQGRKSSAISLLDHLEKQKEETSRLLEKSRAKQNEMMALMSLSYQNQNSSVNKNGGNTAGQRPKI